MEINDNPIKNISYFSLVANMLEDVLEAVNRLVDKSEDIRSLLEADIEALNEWDGEISSFLDALDDVEGLYEWECLQEKEK